MPRPGVVGGPATAALGGRATFGLFRPSSAATSPAVRETANPGAVAVAALSALEGRYSVDLPGAMMVAAIVDDVFVQPAGDALSRSLR